MRHDEALLRGGFTGSRFRAARRCVVFVLGSLGLGLVQLVLMVLRLPAAQWFPMNWLRLCCHVTGIELRRYGAPEARGPVLYVANHASYLDVPVLGSLLEASFVSKAEVADWPLIGWISRLQRPVFIDRQVASAGAHVAALHDRLAAGDSLILFPEGTSNDGNRMLPFKSTLFRAAAAQCDGQSVRVQPVTIAYSRFDGSPMGRNLRPFFAWYGDMTMGGHLWTCLGMGRPGVDVVFHPSVTLDAFASHAELAQYCHGVIARTLSDALAGRLESPPLPERENGADLCGDDDSEDAAKAVFPL